MNVLLWKYGATDWINLCSPYYLLSLDYIYGTKHMHRQCGYGNWIGKIDFYAFHGCKIPENAKHVLENLIEKSTAQTSSKEDQSQ